MSKKKLKKSVKSKGGGGTKARPYRNELELRIWTLARTGYHAIVMWIASMVGEPVYLFEILRAKKDGGGGEGDPYLTRFPTKDHLLSKDRNLEKFFVPLPNMRKWTEEQRQPIRSKSKKCLIYSYLWNHRRRAYFPSKDIGDTVKDRAKILGKSKQQYDIIILRDIYNWFASFIEEGADVYGAKNLAKYVDHWYYLAREGSGKINNMPFKKVFISYNQWFADQGYRKQIAKKFGLSYSDETLNKVPFCGSSFDGLDYQGKAQEMKVLERWQMLSEEHLKLCQKILEAHPRATELSDEIFGKIKGS